MSLIVMNGFETCADDSDFRNQGWLKSPAASLPVAFTPSQNGLAGQQLSFWNSVNSSVNPGASTRSDQGTYSLGMTVNQAWLAGGFAWGFRAKFNSGTRTNYASSLASGNSKQICFDGSKYWAISTTGSTLGISTSTDLQNWTAVPTLPAGALGTGSSIDYLGNGLIAVITNLSTTSFTVYTTSNGAVSWTATVLGTLGSTASPLTGGCIATGNATYPHLVYGSSQSATTGGLAIWVGTLGGTMTSVATANGNGTYWGSASVARVIGSLLVVPTMVGNVFSATASSASLNTAGVWSNATTGLAVHDVAYNPVSNLWILATHTGLYTVPNSGSAGTPVALSGAVTPTSRYSTTYIYNVYWNGSLLVGVGGLGRIVTSPDGITWTETSHILPFGTSGYDWRTAYFDGTRYVLCSDSTSGLIAASPNLTSGFVAKYAQEPTEYVPTSYTSTWTGIAAGTGTLTSGGTWTNSTNVAYIKGAAVSSGTRTVGLSFANGTVVYPTTVSVTDPTQLQHYYEIVATATGTSNTFNVAWYLDGVLIGTQANQLCAASTSDTTSFMVMCLAPGATWTTYDDMYFTTATGGVTGQQGAVNILVLEPATDVGTEQWTSSITDGNANPNSRAVSKLAASSDSNYVTSSAPATDKYTISGNLSAGKILAVQLEAQSTTTNGNGQLQLNLQDANGTQTGTAAATNGSVFVTQKFATDSTGAAWTSTSIKASDFVLNRTA